MIRLIFVAGIFLLFSCTSKPKEETTTQEQLIQYTFYGDSISPDDFVLANKAIEKLGTNDSLQIKLQGKVNEVCQKKGCWMMIALNDSTEMRVRFKDYAFFMPMDIANDTAIFEGWMYRDSVSVDELQHYAKDAGKTQAEIDAIKTPQFDYLFEANGVLLKK